MISAIYKHPDLWEVGEFPSELRKIKFSGLYLASLDNVFGFLVTITYPFNAAVKLGLLYLLLFLIICFFDVL